MHVAHNIEGLYVHVPFCDGKCHYCAFYSVSYSRDLGEAWLAAVEKELAQALDRYGALPLTSIFMGGGTPTVLPCDQLERLLIIVKSSIKGSGLRVLEWTSEANPGSLSIDKLTLMKAFGVNRISLGVQAMEDQVLRQLGRRHSVADIHAAVNAIKSSGITNWGLDLIACVPGVSEDAWRKTLDAALRLEPRHISVYALTREEGTRLNSDYESGMVRLLDDDNQLRMLEVAESTLGAAGFGRYEISNYARSGFECRHNVSCWRGGNYLGLGCAASSRVGNQRWTNVADLNAYTAAVLSSDQASIRWRDTEALAPVTDAVERLVFGLRLAEGVDLEEILDVTGLTGSVQADAWRATLARLARERLVENRAGRWTLTVGGQAMADHVAVELMP